MRDKNVNAVLYEYELALRHGRFSFCHRIEAANPDLRTEFATIRRQDFATSTPSSLLAKLRNVLMV